MRTRLIPFMVLGLVLVSALACTAAANQPIPDGIYSYGVVELSLVNGNWAITHGSFINVEEGTYTVAGNQIQFNLVKQASADECSTTQKSFAYQWSVAAKSITLTKLDDTCEIRISDLTGSALSLKGAGQ